MRRHVCLRERDEADCPICLEPMRHRKTMHLGCGHVTHLSCWRKLRAHSRNGGVRCPMCRAVALEPELVRLLIVGSWEEDASGGQYMRVLRIEPAR